MKLLKVNDDGVDVVLAEEVCIREIYDVPYNILWRKHTLKNAIPIASLPLLHWKQIPQICDREKIDFVIFPVWPDETFPTEASNLIISGALDKNLNLTREMIAERVYWISNPSPSFLDELAAHKLIIIGDNKVAKCSRIENIYLCKRILIVSELSQLSSNYPYDEVVLRKKINNTKFYFRIVEDTLVFLSAKQGQEKVEISRSELKSLLEKLEKETQKRIEI